VRREHFLYLRVPRNVHLQLRNFIQLRVMQYIKMIRTAACRWRCILSIGTHSSGSILLLLRSRSTALSTLSECHCSWFCWISEVVTEKVHTQSKWLIISISQGKPVERSSSSFRWKTSSASFISLILCWMFIAIGFLTSAAFYKISRFPFKWSWC